MTHRQVAGRDPQTQRRRLVLTSSQVVPDSHKKKVPPRSPSDAVWDVRTAAESIRLLAERVEPVHIEDIPHGDKAPPMVGAQCASAVGSS